MQTKQTFSTRYYCRECKKNKNGLAPIELSIIVNGERVFVSLPRKMAPSDFIKETSRAASNDTKRFLSLYDAKVNNAVTEILTRNELMTAQRIKDYITGNVCHQFTLKKVILEHMKLLNERTRAEISLECYKRYDKAYNSLLDFIGDKDILAITTGDMLAYKAKILNNYQVSSAYGYLAKCKTLFKFCVDNGWLTHSPMNGIKTPRGEKKKETISEEEYIKIRDIRFDIQRLERVRKIFVLMCSCGLAYCDIQRLEPSDIQYINGKMVIEKPRKKTGVTFTSVVLEDGVKIIEELNGDFSLLKISDQKLNSYLKSIADHCKISRNLTSHLARHYYITHLMRIGMPIQIIQKAAGHSNVKMTLSYTHLTNDDVVNAFK